MASASNVAFHPLATKVSTPEYTQHSLERLRLEFPQQEIPSLKLLGIVAPAGYGKSTLMAQWKAQMEKQDFACAWINLDEEENDLANFFRYLVHSFHLMDPEISREAMATLEAGSLGDPKPIWQTLMHHLSQSPGNYALFLDDFHKIIQKDVLAFTEWLIRYLPRNLIIVVASRPKLKLNIQKLKSYGEIRVYEYLDLRFDAKETELFFNDFHHLQLTAKQISKIHDNSEGWVLILQMIAILSKRHQDLNSIIEHFSGKHEEIGAYLGEVILENVDEELRNFLFKISILDRFCSDLTDELLNLTQSRKNIRRIQDLNLFLIPLDHENRWFRFHHLFGDFLQEGLRKETPGLEGELQRKASAWFESRGYFNEAIEYALRARDFDTAGRLISGYAPEIIENKGDTTTLFQWMQRLPKEYKIKYPAIWPSLILSYYVTHNFKKVGEELQLFHRTALQTFQEGKINAVEYRRLQETIHFLKVDADVFDFKVEKFRYGIFDWLEKWPEADPFQKTALEMCIGSATLYTHEYRLGFTYAEKSLGDCLEIKNYYAYSWAVSVVSSLGVRNGEIHRAIEYSEKCLPLIEEKIGANSYAAHMVSLHLAECLYLQGKISEATSHLKIPLNYLENWGAHLNIISCLSTYARLSSLQNDFTKALSYAQFGKKLGKKRRHPFLVTYFKSLEIDLHLLQNQSALAKRTFDNLEEDFISPKEDRFLSAYQKEIQFLCQVKISLHQKQARKILDKLNEHVANLKKTERIRDLIDAFILQAAALEQEQRRVEAIRALHSALQLATHGEYVMPFVEFRYHLKDIFKEAFERLRQESPLNAAYETRLFQGMQVESSAAPTEPLTKREREILHALESGKNNRELAKRLYISEQTLKWHLQNLFKKFKVKNRTELILLSKRIDAAHSKGNPP